jgi:hypothetical protein
MPTLRFFDFPYFPYFPYFLIFLDAAGETTSLIVYRALRGIPNRYVHSANRRGAGQLRGRVEGDIACSCEKLVGGSTRTKAAVCEYVLGPVGPPTVDARSSVHPV